MYIINVYMPCRGIYSTEEFQQELDQVHEICQKCAHTPTLLVGDFNIDIHGKQDVRTRYFINFIKENNLREAFNMHEHTFHQHSGKGSSKIDYIFYNPPLQQKVKSAEYRTLIEPLNLSAHSPLLLKLTVDLDKEILSQPHNPAKKKRLIWSKADKDLYNDTVAAFLDTSCGVSDPNLAVDYITKSLHKAAEIAVPTTSDKVKQAPYNPRIAHLMSITAAAFSAWVKAGKPDKPHPAAVARKHANNQLRAAQRQQKAINRAKDLDSLHQASSSNTRLMFSIVRKQRGQTTTSTNELIIDNEVYTDDLLPAWIRHFSNLALPSDNPNFTHYRIESATKNINHIRQLMPTDYKLKIPITSIEVRNAIKKMKFHKAADVHLLQAEHVRTACDPVIDFLTPMYNTIIETGEYPPALKEGLRHPILKKGKLMIMPGNYRGISISAILGKILDKIHLDHQDAATADLRFHPLQFGFSPGRSCTQAAFIVSESIAEAKDKSIPLYIAAIDVQKAFDVVRHESLLDRLYQLGLMGAWWKLKDSAYKDLKERIAWKGEISNPFPIKVGSKQGAYPSATDYVSHIVTALLLATTSSLGFSIGTIIVSTPTCADDMIIMSSSPTELQTLINLITSYANEEHYVIHPQKTVIVPYNTPKLELEFLMSEDVFFTNDTPIPVEKEFIHLGIRRSIDSPLATVEDRTSLARKTFYAMMGAGLHGLNGLPVTTCLLLYNVYIVPRLLYGLEAIKLTDQAISKLEVFHRYALRSILGLPGYTATPALHILTGQLPMENQLDIKYLTFLRSLLSVEPCREIILRQYANKTAKSNSLINTFRKKLFKYDLPTVYDLYTNTPSKDEWKKRVKSAVISKATDEIVNAAVQKSTLGFISKCFKHKEVHPVVAQVENHRQVTRANIKTRLLTKTYPIQETRQRVKKASHPTCPLCQYHTEDTAHFVLECPELEGVRRKYLIIHTLQPNQVLLCETILDSRLACTLNPDLDVERWERLTRDFLYALHLHRTSAISTLPK